MPTVRPRSRRTALVDRDRQVLRHAEQPLRRCHICLHSPAPSQCCSRPECGPLPSKLTRCSACQLPIAVGVSSPAKTLHRARTPALAESLPGRRPSPTSRCRRSQPDPLPARGRCGCRGIAADKGDVADVLIPLCELSHQRGSCPMSSRPRMASWFSRSASASAWIAAALASPFARIASASALA